MFGAGNPGPTSSGERLLIPLPKVGQQVGSGLAGGPLRVIERRGVQLLLSDRDGGRWVVDAWRLQSCAWR